jgi:hypothetical protein
MHGVYVASRASVPERAAFWREMRAAGAPIISTWIDEAGPGETADLGELWARIGREVASARWLVAYVEPGDFPLKGALVEVGMALALGKPVTLCAPGVQIEERSCRPIGSWMRHPLVTRLDDVHLALLPPAAEPQLITAEWLASVGFKWHQLDRQPDKHWLLWLGAAVREQDDSLTSFEDIGIELAPMGGRDVRWFCWLRSDASHRYHRFIHVRHLRTREDLIRLVEAVSGQAWDPANHFYGSLVGPRQAEQYRAEADRLDRQIRRTGHPWYGVERDDTRGGALPEHLEAHEKARGTLSSSNDGSRRHDREGAIAARNGPG